MSSSVGKGNQSPHPCKLSSLKRQVCHNTHGIQNEECIREELIEKRCYAELLCRREANKFYNEPLPRHRRRNQMMIGSASSKGSCSALVELFAFPENELILPDLIDKEDRKHCRKIVHELSKCLSKHKVGSRTTQGHF